MPGALEAVLEVVTVGVDVADLAAGPQLLAVEVHPQPRVAGQGVRVAVVQPARPRPAGRPGCSPSPSTAPAAPASPSGRSRTARRWFSNWLVTAPSWVQWPVLCGRIASSLTSTRPSRVSNSSTARIPMTSSSLAIVSATCCACVGQPRVEVGRRGHDLVADAVELGARDDGVRRGLATRRAGHQRRQLATEVDELLGEHLDAGLGRRRERLLGLVGVADRPHPSAVVPAAGDLEHARQPERLDVRRPTSRRRAAGTAPPSR